MNCRDVLVLCHGTNNLNCRESLGFVSNLGQVHRCSPARRWLRRIPSSASQPTLGRVVRATQHRPSGLTLTRTAQRFHHRWLVFSFRTLKTYTSQVGIRPVE
jgi:hypothetical protein